MTFGQIFPHFCKTAHIKQEGSSVFLFCSLNDKFSASVVHLRAIDSAEKWVQLLEILSNHTTTCKKVDFKLARVSALSKGRNINLFNLCKRRLQCIFIPYTKTTSGTFQVFCRSSHVYE